MTHLRPQFFWYFQGPNGIWTKEKEVAGIVTTNDTHDTSNFRFAAKKKRKHADHSAAENISSFSPVAPGANAEENQVLIVHVSFSS